MNIRKIVTTLLVRRRRAAHPEIAAAWNTRLWADLPTYHPRRDEDALH